MAELAEVREASAVEGHKIIECVLGGDFLLVKNADLGSLTIRHSSIGFFAFLAKDLGVLPRQTAARQFWILVRLGPELRLQRINAFGVFGVGLGLGLAGQSDS